MYMLFENAGAEGQMVRLIAIPRFCEKGVAVVVIFFYFNLPFNIVAIMGISFYFESPLPPVFAFLYHISLVITVHVQLC